MAGLNRETGRPLDAWEHLKQSLLVLLTTRIGERVMRRAFGSDVPPLLGERLVPSTVLRFFTAIIVAIELWEPRYRVTRVGVSATAPDADRARSGRLGIAIEGEFRPRGHLGDFTPAGPDPSIIEF